MPFAPGTLVRVISLNRTGEIVESARGGRYRVRVGAVVLSCREADLAESDIRGPRKGRREAAEAGPRGESVSRNDAHRATSPPDTLDLHGLSVEEALRAVADRIDAVLRGGLDHLDIIHGRGSGRIRVAVHKFLREVGAVRHFALDPANPGVTRVRF